MALPNFFILGAGRSGTTSLCVLLRRHPDIFIPQIKEPSFFAESFQWIRSPVRYAALYSEADEPLRGDASHIYLEDPTSAPTLKAFTPDARFIIVLRNPADRARALYSYMVEHGQEIMPTLEKALAAEDRRFHSERFRRTCAGSFWNYMYFRSGLYAEQIERYLDQFPEDRFFVATLPELIEHTGDVVRRMCEFLGVQAMDVDHFPRDGTSKGVRSTAAQVLTRKYVRPLAKRDVPGAEPLLTWASQRNRTQPAPMVPETKSTLMHRYTPDLTRLRELTGVDLLS